MHGAEKRGRDESEQKREKGKRQMRFIECLTSIKSLDSLEVVIGDPSKMRRVGESIVHNSRFHWPSTSHFTALHV